jgi:hypothetical protein
LTKDHTAYSRLITSTYHTDSANLTTRKSTQSPWQMKQHTNTSPEVAQTLYTHPRKCASTRKPRHTAAATRAPSPSSRNAATTHRRPASNAQTQTHHHRKSSPTPSAGPACRRRWAHSSFANSYLANLYSRRRRSLRLSEVVKIGWIFIGVSMR